MSNGSSSDNNEPVTILLAEDEAMVRELISQFLGNLGYRVVGAGDGGELLRSAKAGENEGFRLLITDLVMPNMGGVELASALRADRPDLPVLFISGYTDDVVVIEGDMGKNTAFLKKPFNFDTLKKRVADLVTLADRTDETG